MSVVKIKKRETPYILIDKKGVRDPRLSWKATGLLTYLIGLPEDWKIRLNNLATCKIDGLTACKSALRELREYNYCHYFEVRKSGKVVETFYIVYEVPTPYSEELKEDLFLTEDIDSTYDLFYKSVKKSETKKQNKEEKSEEKVIEEELGKKEIKIEKPKVENQLSVKKAKK